MAAFQIITKYFWLFAILLSVFHSLMAKRRVAKRIKADPQLSREYSKLIRAYFGMMAAPWVVMGIGSTIGGVPTMWHFFRPKDGNPFVLAWFASIIFLWVTCTIWLFFRGGAETLIKYPEVINLKNTDRPVFIKQIWVLSLLGGVMGMIFMWLGNIPLPPVG